jgi:two-component system, OmpR family, copper resistance phosphate regulon response regulator CusR
LHLVPCHTMEILIIEDEQKLAEAIAEGLTKEGFNTAVAYTGELGLKMLHEVRFDLVVIDLMLPGMNGLSVLRDLRRSGYSTPALILTARDSIQDRVLGLDLGADDYLVKPFAFPELLARIRSLLRRGRPAFNLPMHIADLFIDLSGRIVTRGGEILELTSREFDLLEYFLINQGSVVSREMLARDVWKEIIRSQSMDNVIDVQVGRLRRKIDDPFAKKLLHTVRGVGFVLREEDVERGFAPGMCETA